MTTWFTSDQHFGHEKIIRFCDRPFADVDEMNAELVKRWNDVVAEDDTVYVLGDYAMGRIEDTLPLTGQLNGDKILLAGNHDRCWWGHQGWQAWRGRYTDAGFVDVRQGVLELTMAGFEVRACHFPYVGDSHDADRYLAHRPSDDGGWLLHGHVHQLWLRRERMINVGVDVWDFYPVAEGDLIGIMERSGSS